MIHKYLHFARHSLTTPLHSPSTATLLAFFAAQHPLRNSSAHFWPFLPPETSLQNPSATLWTTSVTLKVCNQYSQIAQSTHPSHLKRHSTDNDQVTVQGVNIITHLKVKEPSTVPPIGAPPFQVRNTTRTWNCIYPIIIKLQF